MKNPKVRAAYKKRFGKEPPTNISERQSSETLSKLADQHQLYDELGGDEPKSERALIYTLALSLALFAKEVKEVIDQWP